MVSEMTTQVNKINPPEELDVKNSLILEKLNTFAMGAKIGMTFVYISKKTTTFACYSFFSNSLRTYLVSSIQFIALLSVSPPLNKPSLLEKLE